MKEACADENGARREKVESTQTQHSVHSARLIEGSSPLRAISGCEQSSVNGSAERTIEAFALVGCFSIEVMSSAAMPSRAAENSRERFSVSQKCSKSSVELSKLTLPFH